MLSVCKLIRNATREPMENKGILGEVFYLFMVN